MEENRPARKFPKAGDCVVFTEQFHLRSGNYIETGQFCEVLESQVHPHNGESYSYFIYLGMEDGFSLEFNYSLHHKKLQIVPNTVTSKVLYGK